MVISSDIRAWLYLVPLIPSLIVSIFVLYHLLINRASRAALNNHVIILLLLMGLIEELLPIVSIIHNNRVGVALSSTPAYCLAWVFIGSAASVSISILMAWASMERHILVFHPTWLRTKTNQYLFHYLPLAICILWPTIFYFVMYFILPCDRPFYYYAKNCGRTGCLTAMPAVSLFDSIAHFIVPAFVVVIFSVALLVRVIYKRFRARGRIDWRNYRKMATQLLSISTLYLFLAFPPMLLYAAYSAGMPRNIASDYYSDTVFFNLWTVLFTPFASAVSLPDLKTKCRSLVFFWRKKNTVQPVTTGVARPKVNQTVAVVPVVQ